MSRWSIDGDIEQRVEQQLDYNYQWGLQRQSTRWSFTGRALFDRDGTPRFFGIGNETTLDDETNYTSQEELMQVVNAWLEYQRTPCSWTIMLRG